MSFKTAFISILLAGATLAAPTTPSWNDLEKRADWQAGKCEAHVHLDNSNGLALDKHTTSKWALSIVDTEGAQVALWNGDNPADINIATTRGYNFVVEGFPGGSVDGNDHHNALTLKYDTPVWNSLDCYRYNQKSARPSNGWRHEFDWYCQFDC